MKRLTFFVTGSDTSAGKTVVACLLAGHLRRSGVPVAALKPVCSGNRADARALRAASGNVLTLDETNPWHFRASLAPLLAARIEKRKVKPADVVAYARRMQKRFPVLVIEGAGGLLSPLGETFDSRDLIQAIRANPIVVCPNRLGAVNQARLVIEALPPVYARHAQVVLVNTSQSDTSRHTNPRLLGEWLGGGRVHVLPWLKFPNRFDLALANRQTRQILDALTVGWDFGK